MATGPTLYQKKQAARRATADIERLAKSYQTGIFDVAQEQQKGFTDWTAQTKAVMEPYETAVKKYTQEDFPAYQKRVAEKSSEFQSQMADYNQTMATYDEQVAAYRQRLDAFNKTILDITENPSEMTNIKGVPRGRSGLRYNIGGTEYSEYNLPQGYFLENVVVGQGTNRGRKYDITEKRVFKTKAIPTFTEEPPGAPTAAAPTLGELPAPPAAPEAPQALPAFDTAPFAQKRQQLASTFQREVGERKAAKQNVVMRRMSRGMLQGA